MFLIFKGEKDVVRLCQLPGTRISSKIIDFASLFYVGNVRLILTNLL